MASFSKNLPLKYQELDYNGVIGNYNWIKDTVSLLFENIVKSNCRIGFRMGDISCYCELIEEFSEHAYGQVIDVYSYNLSFYQNGSDKNRIPITYITINTTDKTLTVDCDNRKNLITICTALENSMNPNLSTSENQTQINNYIHDESTHITIGDNNSIQNTNIGKNNTVHTETPSPKKSFWKSVLQILKKVVCGFFGD